MQSHEVTIGGDRDDGWWGFCTCDWRGRTWSQRHLAVMETGDHLLSLHIPDHVGFTFPTDEPDWDDELARLEDELDGAAETGGHAITLIEDLTREDQYRAQCLCSWQSEGFRSKDDVYMAAAAHLATANL